MPDDFTVAGNIASRWNAYGAALGPFGRPTGPEHEVSGQNGRRQTFEFGEIAFSTDQQMVVSVFRLRNEACFEWSPTQFEYDYYRYDIAFNGVPQGQAARKHAGQLRVWTLLQGFGEYAFIVKGCHSPLIGADHCDEGFTIPVRMQFTAFTETPDPGGPPVSGLIADFWHQLGAWDGPLGNRKTVEGFKNGIRSQQFKRGSITTAPAFGPEMVVAAFQRGHSIDLQWGGADRPFNAFRVDIYMGGRKIAEQFVWLFLNTEWARMNRGSGRLFLADPGTLGGTGTYIFFVFPVQTANPMVTPSDFPANAVPTAEAPPPGSTPQVRVNFELPGPDVHLDLLPLGYTPGQSYASQPSRATAIARAYALALPLFVAFPPASADAPEATENDMFQLIAHAHAASEEPDFRVPGELPSSLLAHVRMRQYRRGKVGTKRDYDMCLKGLMTVVYRYRAMWTDKEIELMLRDLIPEDLFGKHNPAVEIALSVLGKDIPETENHLLMIESTRYFANQLQLELTGDERFDNNRNGLTGWLLDFIANIARFDFLEFNARPYTRLSVYVLLNLYEFAPDDALRLAAQHVLDYLMVKFAVSSNRYRRVAPFRRLQERTSHPETPWNDVTAPNGDLLTGFFMVYCGHIDEQHRLRDHFPGGWTEVCVIPATSSYRPPPAAYRLAMERRGPIQHRFVHGQRPPMPRSPENADGGVEIYFSSPSFLLSAGGMFLNSGYGRDEFEAPGLKAFAQAARAQAITLLPTRADLSFADAIRFDPFPDFRTPPDPEKPIKGQAVTTGVHRGFACGANLRVPQRWLDVAGTAIDGPWIFLDLNRAVTGGQLGFYVAAYHTPVRDLSEVPDIDPLLPAALQARLENLGCLYAIEADRMPFDTFKRLTLERNTHLPARFGYAETHDFHTADLHTFTFLLAPSVSVRDKYHARVRAMDGVAIPDHFGTLPLVDGEHLRSPERGVIEIHAPDCPTPLRLDARDSRHPQRSDDVAACPAPWRDRDEQVIGFALQWLTRSRELTAELKPIECVAAVRQAVITLRRHVPLPENETRYWDVLEMCVQALALRLIDAHLHDEALQRIDETIDVAKRAASLPNSNRHSLAGQLLNLSTQITVSISSAAAIPPVQAAIDILRSVATLSNASAEVTSLFAVSLQTLTDRLFDAQRPADAAVTAREAIAAYRRAAAAPGANVPPLAGQLVSLATRLTANALLADAVTSLETSAAIARPIATASDAPAETRALFAVVLQTLTLRLLDARRQDETPPVVREAISAYRHASDAPGANREALGTELFTLSGSLAAAGLAAEAVSPIQASTDILRGAAATPGVPVATLALFAVALQTLTLRLLGADRRDETSPVVREAIAAYRHAADAPGANREALGTELFTLSGSLAAAGLAAEAVSPIQASTDILRGAAATPGVPVATLALFAVALQTLTLRLLGADRRDETSPVVREAIAAYRHAADAPGANREALGTELFTLSGSLAAAGLAAEAVSPIQASTDILRGAAATPGVPVATLALFAVALQTLTLRLLGADRRDETSPVVREAIAAYRHAADAPGANREALGTELFTLSGSLAAAGLAAEAVSPIQASTDILRGAAATPGVPVATLALFAVALQTLTLRLLGASRLDETSPVVREAIAAYRHAADAPGANREALGTELFTLSGSLAAAGLAAEAVPPIQASTDILRGAAVTPGVPVATRSLFAALLHTQAQRLVAVDRRTEALAAAEEAIVFYRSLAAEDSATFGPQLAAVEQLAATLRP